MTFDRQVETTTETLTTYQCAQSDVEQLLSVLHQKEAHLDDGDLNTANDTLSSSWITNIMDLPHRQKHGLRALTTEAYRELVHPPNTLTTTVPSNSVTQPAE